MYIHKCQKFQTHHTELYMPYFDFSMPSGFIAALYSCPRMNMIFGFVLFCCPPPRNELVSLKCLFQISGLALILSPFWTLSLVSRYRSDISPVTLSMRREYSLSSFPFPILALQNKRSVTNY